MLLLLACTTTPEFDSTIVDSAPCDAADSDASLLDIEGLAPCGEPIFKTACGTCHGDDGRGADGPEAGPDLAEHVAAHTDEEIAYVLLVGQGDMPAPGLSNAENAHVLAWLRERFGDYNGEGH